MPRQGDTQTHLLNRLTDNCNDNLAVVLIHTLFAQDLDNDLRTQVEGRAETSVMREDGCSMAEVDDPSTNSAQEGGDDTDKDVLLLQLRTSLCAWG